jgi:hemerythrin-like domain-containing protein
VDAIKLLKQQHRLVERLFERYEGAGDSEKEAIFYAIADNLAIHTTIEEKHFYPAVRQRQTEENVVESFDEHLEIKKLLLEAMNATEDPGFDDKVAVLRGAVDYHVEEEEGELFPKVEQLITPEALDAIGDQMELDTDELKREGDARKTVRVETEPPGVQP